VKLAAMKSADLMNSTTDLIALVNTADAPITILNTTYSASAVGYIYLDDGTSAIDTARIDFYVNNYKNGTVDIHFVTVTMPKNLTDKGRAAQVSGITFLWAQST